MQQAETKAYIEKRLPARLMKKLYSLARKYDKKGAQVFIFGSFASSTDRKTSDLDLGVTWSKKRSARIFSEIYQDIQKLPTIRKIDLVDMELVDEVFKIKAMKRAVFLLDKQEVNE
jgi:predicted nucleotidyltransferase